MTSGKRAKAQRRVQQVGVNPIAKRPTVPAFRGSYSDEMMTELAKRLIELEEIVQNHLASHAAIDARPVPKDVAFRKAECEFCKVGAPHVLVSTCKGFKSQLSERVDDEGEELPPLSPAAAKALGHPYEGLDPGDLRHPFSD